MNQRAYGLSRTNKPEFYGELQNMMTGAGYESNLRNIMTGASGPQNTVVYSADQVPGSVQGFYVSPTIPSENVSSLIRASGLRRTFPEASNAQPGDMYAAFNAAPHELLHRAAYSPLMQDEGVQAVIDRAFREIGGSSRSRASGINRGRDSSSELFAYMLEPEENNFFMQNPDEYARMLQLDRVPTRAEIADVRRRYLPELEAALESAMNRRTNRKVNDYLVDQMPRRGYPAP
jgi:hypothetical protein